MKKKDFLKLVPANDAIVQIGSEQNFVSPGKMIRIVNLGDGVAWYVIRLGEDFPTLEIHPQEESNDFWDTCFQKAIESMDVEISGDMASIGDE